MITLKKITFAFIAISFFTFAQAQKIAHVSLDSLMASMPETKTAREEVQNYVKGFEAEILTMQTELETKYKDYMDKRETMSEPVKQNKEQDMQQLQKRIEDFKTQAGQDVQAKQAELGVPILQKVKKGIDAVAKEGGYKYVLNTSVSNTGTLYNESSDDIFAAVKKKLDSMPLANLPNKTGSNKTPTKPTNTSKTNTPKKTK